jgi:hypothetical protein
MAIVKYGVSNLAKPSRRRAVVDFLQRYMMCVILSRPVDPAVGQALWSKRWPQGMNALKKDEGKSLRFPYR